MPWRRLPILALGMLLLVPTVEFARGAETVAAEPGPDQQEKDAILAVRRFTTNLQFHENGSVRLARFSKQVVTDEMLSNLRHFRQLDYLAVVCPQVSDVGISNVEHLKNLDTLLLSESGISDRGLRDVQGLASLERLYLDDTAVTDAGLAHVGNLEQLDTLSLRETDVTDEGLKHLSSLKKLRTLLLNDTQVTGSGLQHLAGLPELRTLYLNGCPLDADALRDLKSLKQLEVLGLSRTSLTDSMVAVLKSCGSLKQLELWQTNASSEQLASLEAELRGLKLFAARAGRDATPDASKGGEINPPSPSATLNAGSASTASRGLQPILQVPYPERLNDADWTPDFQRHVIPLLGRLGCNGRACHGSFQGRGGFRLSMFGYDFESDRKNLLDRVDAENPAESLVLTKPASEDEHGGGLRLPPGQWQQALLQRWIERGAGGVPSEAARFARLEVTPREVVFRRAGETTQLRVIAVWSDGSREDVTELTRFQTNDDAVARVSDEGVIESVGPGDCYVISFYDNGIFSTQVLHPLTELVDDAYPDVEGGTPLDEPVHAKLRKLGIVPSELCTDDEFLRRVSLDLIGTLPTPEEVLAFCNDGAEDKRDRKIDELLESPAYVTWWTTRLCDLTGSNAGYLGGTEMAQPVAAQWRAWIERRVRDNVGWDQIANGIVSSSSRRDGQPYEHFVMEQSRYTRRKDADDFAAAGNPMPHFWFRSNLAQPSDKALAFGYSFLGVRLDCAQCHKHPFDQWSKQDFELFTEFFKRIKAGVSPDAAPIHEHMRNMLGVPVKLNTAALRRQSYLRIAAEGRPIPWREVYVEPPGDKPQPAKLLGGDPVDLSLHEDPRELLMEWLLTEPNRYFAKAFVNRIWANYFHVGIIDPPDDLNQANPPSNKALLGYLTDGFVESGYDMKWLHQTIARSHTYQRSWRPNETNRTDRRNFSRSIVRRMPAEVAMDAVLQSTVRESLLATSKSHVVNRKIGQHPKSFQARSIDYSLLVFGKPLRTTNCDCERRSEPTLLQALYLRNDGELLTALNRSDGWLAELRKKSSQAAAAEAGAKQVDDWVRSAYLRTLSRLPNDREKELCRGHFAAAETPLEGLQDLLWSLLNTQEFITNH